MFVWIVGFWLSCFFLSQFCSLQKARKERRVFCANESMLREWNRVTVEKDLLEGGDWTHKQWFLSKKRLNLSSETKMYTLRRFLNTWKIPFLSLSEFLFFLRWPLTYSTGPRYYLNPFSDIPHSTNNNKILTDEASIAQFLLWKPGKYHPITGCLEKNNYFQKFS